MSADPTFLGLGVLKAGTTLLHTWLAEHPQVCVPKDRKEVRFFDMHYDRGIDWYRNLFEPTIEPAAGEFSNSYLGSEAAMRRIAHHLPGVKCVVSLRDPVARLDSQYRHFVMVSGYRGSRQAFTSEHPNAVDRGYYAPQLERLLELFPAEQIEVLVFEEFVRNPETAAEQLYRFVGVDPAYRPASLHRRVNPTRGVRRPRVMAAIQAASTYATQHDMRWLLRLGRRARFARFALDRTGQQGLPPRIGPDEEERLRGLYERDVVRTSELLGKDLISVWRWDGAR